MAYQLSPGVLVTERDLTTGVPSVATTVGGFAGGFNWGPAEVPTLVTTEAELAATFGTPDSNTYISFFTAANFLAYGNQLWVTRGVDASDTNASANSLVGGPVTTTLIKNQDAYDALNSNVNTFVSAKYPGLLGNSLGIVLLDSNNWSAASTTYSTSLFDYKPNVTTYATTYGLNAGANVLDEVHVAIVDEDGLISGIKGTVLEKFPGLSKASDAVSPQGTSIYYATYLSNNSNYVWWRGHPNFLGNVQGATWGQSITANTAIRFANTTLTGTVISLTGGQDIAANASTIANQYLLYNNDQQYDISLLPTGSLEGTNVQSIIQNVAEVRKDCMVFTSPPLSNVNVSLSESSKSTNVVNYRTNNLNISSSFAVMDSGWKYQYDRYNDTYRWIPLNGDIAGLCARTDFVADPWFSPGGFNRGQIKNVVKLAFNPSKSYRDNLYKNGINPVISSPGNGTVLFGDKTMLSKPSAFDRINVRRLFIVIEKAISAAAQYQLFEFNDEFTRAQFRNLVVPYLRDVKARRGITDFKVVCDSSNNTSTVIDRNEFVADIYVKPARSINFISLNFIATRTGVSFNEVTG
jgi:hypothetical protein